MASTTAPISSADVTQIQRSIAELLGVAARKNSMQTNMFVGRLDARLFPSPMKRDLSALVNASPPDETLRAKIEAFVKGKYASFPLSSAPVSSTPVSISTLSPVTHIPPRLGSGPIAPTERSSPSSPPPLTTPSVVTGSLAPTSGGTLPLPLSTPTLPGATPTGPTSPGSSSLLSGISTGTAAPKEILALVLMPVFATQRVALPTTKFCYNAHTNDFGIQIQDLVFTRPDILERGKMDGKERKGAAAGGPTRVRRGKKDPIHMDHFPKNMSALAARLGCTVTYSAYSYPVRDHWLRQTNGKILTSCDIVDEAPFIAALHDTQSRAVTFKSQAGALSEHPFLKGMVGYAREDHNKATNDLEIHLGSKEVPGFRFFFEGGNHWIVTHPTHKGRRLLVIGDDTFNLALNHLILTDFFKDPHLNLKTRFLNQLRELNPTKIERTMRLINSQPKIAERLTGTPQEKCATYLAEQDIFTTILAMSFEVPNENIFMIPQLNYHLDVFSHPGPKGSMFVQDYGLCVQILEQIKAASETLGLTPKDREILERYLSTARQLNTELAPLQAATKAAFARAGITVLPTPGIFFDSAPDGTPRFNVNFLNSITTWSPVTSKYHYVTAGAQVGDRLGSVLMDAFALFLEQYQTGLEVHFIGGDPALPGDYSEAMAWWNRVESQAGPHCMSFERATKAHEG